MKLIELKQFIGVPVKVEYLSKLGHPNISNGILDHAKDGFTVLRTFDDDNNYVIIRNCKIKEVTKL